MKGWFVLLLMLVVRPVFAASEIDDIKSLYNRPESIPFPDDNPYSVVKATLGKMLFFDPRLSSAQNMNCASCHNPSFGWEQPTAKSVGAQATPLRRNSPTLLNMAWATDRLFWDGRAHSLEDQAQGPIESEVEMNQPLSSVVARLKNIDEYQHWFDKAFPGEGINKATVVKAIATYERTIVATEAPFDRWIKGDEKAISASAKQGFNLFTGKAKCITCHSGWNFTDNQFHDVGLPGYEDLGRYEITGDIKDKFGFKTPTLRNITQRAPYMHDGSIPDLAGVIDHYIQGGIPRDSLSPLMQPVPLTSQEKSDLIAFLKTLTGPDMVVSLPDLPN